MSLLIHTVAVGERYARLARGLVASLRLHGYAGPIVVVGEKVREYGPGVMSVDAKLNPVGKYAMRSEVRALRTAREVRSQKEEGRSGDGGEQGGVTRTLFLEADCRVVSGFAGLERLLLDPAEAETIWVEKREQGASFGRLVTGDRIGAGMFSVPIGIAGPGTEFLNAFHNLMWDVETRAGRIEDMIYDALVVSGRLPFAKVLPGCGLHWEAGKDAVIVHYSGRESKEALLAA